MADTQTAPQTAQLSNAYRVAQATAATLVATHVALAFRHVLDPFALDKSFAAYAGVAGRLISAGRAQTAALGRAFYLAHRAASGVLGAAPEIVTAGALPAAQLSTSLLVTGPIAVKQAIARGVSLPDALAVAERRTTGAAFRHVADGGRDTIAANAVNDPHALGWARVTDGHPCFFCAMLASRDVFYKTKESATTAWDGAAYHDHCGCFAVPVYDRSAPLPGRGEEFQKLWGDSTKGLRGKDAINAFRQAYEGGTPPSITPKPEPVPVPTPHEADFARWRVGRDVKVVKLSNHDDLTREWAERDLADATGHLAKFRATIVDRERQWKESGMKGSSLAAAKRRDLTLRNAQDGEKYELQREADAHARLAALPDENLPAFDRDNPLAAYGDRLVMHDESEQVYRHMSELETFMPIGAHRLLRDHFAQEPGAGFFLGDAPVPELDDLGHLRNQQPRGWGAGRTWQDVDGAYNPRERVCACGGKVNGAGTKHSSTALHEGAHALDHALDTQGTGYASDTEAFRTMWRAVLSAHGSRLNVRSYFTPTGNPTGYYSEAFAEAFSEWSQARKLYHGNNEAMAEAIGRGLTFRKNRQDQDVYTKHAIAAGRKVMAYFDKWARTLKLDK